LFRASLDFRVFPGGQLGRPGDSIRNLQNGLADIGLIVMSYHREEMPVSQVVNLPWELGAWENTHALLRAVGSPGPISEEWKQQEMVLLIATTNPPYEIHTGNRALPDLASASGIKLRSPGGSYDEVLQAVGANPVAIPTPETFDAISRGIVDGTVYAFSNWNSMRLSEILNHTTANVRLPSPGGLTYAISRKTFDSLNEAQQRALLEAGRTASIRAQRALLEENETALKTFKSEGLNTYEWPEQDLNTLKEKYTTIRNNWAKNVDASGRAGSETLETFNNMMKAAADNPEDFPPVKLH